MTCDLAFSVLSMPVHGVRTCGSCVTACHALFLSLVLSFLFPSLVCVPLLCCVVACLFLATAEG